MSKAAVIKLFILMGAVFLVGANVKAKPQYMKTYNADPSSKPDLHKKCSICHLNEDDDPSQLNAFGKAFVKAENAITPELRQQFPDLFTAEQGGHTERREQSEKDAKTETPSVASSLGEGEIEIEQGGKRYIVNTKDKTVREIAPASTRESVSVASPEKEPAREKVAASVTQQKAVAAQIDEKKKQAAKIYRPTDVRLINLPTAVPMPKGSLWNDYTHRWPNGDPTSATTLYGLDTRAIPSFGFAYGVTDRIHVGAYRSSSDLARPIMIFAGAGLFSEQKGHPLSLMAHVGLEGQDNFKRNFATSFDLTLARSVTRYAQVYVAPTVTLGDRPYNTDPTSNAPSVTAMAMGIGAAVSIRPTVSLMAEANYRLNEEARYIDGVSGIRRPVIGFGVQKTGASRRHTYSLTFTNGPGTTFAQRSMTRGLQGSDDGLRGLSIGFNLTRRIF